MDHHPGRKGHEARATVGLHHQNAIDAQRRIAQQQVLAHLQVQRHEQGLIDPGGAGRGNVLGRCIGGTRCGCHAQGTAQGVTGRHHFQCHQPGRATQIVGCATHGRKTQRLHAAQSQLRRTGGKGIGRPVVAGHHGVPPDERPRIPVEPVLQAVGKESDSGQGRHSQYHGNHQQAQLASAPVAPQRAPAQGPGRNRKSSHPRTLTHPAQPRVSTKYGTPGLWSRTRRIRLRRSARVAP